MIRPVVLVPIWLWLIVFVLRGAVWVIAFPFRLIRALIEDARFQG